MIFLISSCKDFLIEDTNNRFRIQREELDFTSTKRYISDRMIINSSNMSMLPWKIPFNQSYNILFTQLLVPQSASALSFFQQNEEINYCHKYLILPYYSWVFRSVVNITIRIVNNIGQNGSLYFCYNHFSCINIRQERPTTYKLD